MLIKLLKYRVLVVAFLITAISGVYVCDVLCDLDIYSMNRSCNTSCSTHQQPKTHEDHGYHHDHDSHHQSGQPDQDHHNPMNDDCCEDMTTQVFESFFIEKTTLPTFEPRPTFIFDISFIYTQLISNQLADKQYHIPPAESSPPNKPDIFILGHSLLV